MSNTNGKALPRRPISRSGTHLIGQNKHIVDSHTNDQEYNDLVHGYKVDSNDG